MDTVTAKIDLVLQAKRHGVPIISSMGTGNKLNPAGFEVADIYEDSSLLKRISVTVDEILNEDASLESEKYACIRSFLDQNTANFIDFGTI